MDVRNSHILITGGGSGIGLALAEELTKRGARVVICGRSKEKLERAKERFTGIKYIVCDVSDEARVRAMVEQVGTEFGGIDILVNNAGVLHSYDIQKQNVPFHELEKEVAINFLAPLRLIALFLPLLKTRKEGAIVNVSSALAYVPLHAAPVYSATKAALHSFTHSLRKQLQGTTVKVFEAFPQVTDTEMVGSLSMPKMSPEKTARVIVEGIARNQYEIRIGQAKALYVMSRIAPEFIENQINKMK